jgi:iron(III) transport system permease protein
VLRIPQHAGRRAGGIAALAQIDKTLDEASSTLRGSTMRTLREVVVPLLRPAILATLVFSFTHAMTAVSAIIFLATPNTISPPST